jgi:hypothetical protein
VCVCVCVCVCVEEGGANSYFIVEAFGMLKTVDICRNLQLPLSGLK